MLLVDMIYNNDKQQEKKIQYKQVTPPPKKYHGKYKSVQSDLVFIIALL